jgi:hypothetical protein
MEAVHEGLQEVPGLHWQHLLAGTGTLEPSASTLRFALNEATAHEYSNAQIDDYQGRSRRDFRWYPPLRLCVRARFSDPEERLRGTAGFGFWNDPFLMTGARLPALPRAIWFFYTSPPSNIKLDLTAPGYGWKAATLDASRPAALAWAPVAPLAMLLMNHPSAYRRLWPSIQRALLVRESVLAVDMTQWHTYVLEWGVARSRFGTIQDQDHATTHILEAPSPKGPLGFVMWLDNQYLVATPWGRLQWGLVDAARRQWMEIDWFTIEPLKDDYQE